MDALGERWAANVKARRLERDEAAVALGRARTDAGVDPSGFRLRDVWASLGAGDRREALRLFWREIRVGRPRPEGGTPVKFVRRRSPGVAEIDLPEETAA
jgi:hypothetical protein